MKASERLFERKGKIGSGERHMNPHCAPFRNLCGLLLGFAILAGLVISTGPAASQEGKGKKKKGMTPSVPSTPTLPAVSAPPEDTNDLSMEVNALRTLFLLRHTDTADDDGTQTVGANASIARLNALKKNFADLAKKTADRDAADCSEAYRDLLIKLRAALLVEDEDQAEVFDRKLKALQEEELPDLDDEVAITDGARQKVTEFIGKYVSADQIVNFLHGYGKGLPNPRGLLLSAMRVRSQGNGPKLSGDDWKKTREFTIREVSLQLGGVNEKKTGEYSPKIADLLDQSYKLSETERNGKEAQKLREEAMLMAEKTYPTKLLANIVERDLAEFLSNPRMVSAVEARLDYLKSPKKR
jgi:hypothetical protein